MSCLRALSTIDNLLCTLKLIFGFQILVVSACSSDLIHFVDTILQPRDALLQKMKKFRRKAFVAETLCYQVNRSICLDTMRIIKLVETHIRCLILHPLWMVEKISQWPRCLSPMPCIDSSATPIYRTGNMTLSWIWNVRAICRFHGRLSLFLSFPPFEESAFPGPPALFLFFYSSFSRFWML